MICAFDPSSSCVGFAIIDPEPGARFVRECGVLRPRPYTTDAAKRIRILADDLRAFQEIKQAELVLVENPPKFISGKGNSILVQWRAYGAFMLVLSDLGATVREIDPSTWTRGRKKEEWSFHIRRRFGLAEHSDPGADAAAAVGIADWWHRVGRHRREVVTA